MPKTAPRHAAVRPPGPVTAVIRLGRKPETRLVALLLRGWPAIAPLFLAFPVLRRSPALDDLASLVLGLDATLCLAACVTITPLVNLLRARAARLRWWYGVWTFTLGAAGMLLTLWLNRPAAGYAAGGNATRLTGLVIVLGLLPMAATSNAVAQKLLGAEWKRWQRWLLWAVWAAVLLHLAAIQAWASAAGFAAATVPMIILRWNAGRIKSWRQGGYSTQGWWTALAVLAVCWAAGFTVLLAQLGQACASAVH